MRALIQRVTEASVESEGVTLSACREGIVVLVGIEETDNEEDAEWLAKKTVNLRIFDDKDGVMNLSVKDTGGSIIVVSQFTLHALTKKGNRPSYIRAARPETAVPLYEYFIAKITEEHGKNPGTGRFGAMMTVKILNNGPVTIFIDTKNKE